MNDHRVRTYRLSREEAPSTAVVNAVAEAEGVSPVELPPLYGRVDPDALDELLPREPDEMSPGDEESPDAVPRGRARGEQSPDLQVSFPYHGYDVTVRQRQVLVVTHPSR